jgi:DNA repair protein RadC
MGMVDHSLGDALDQANRETAWVMLFDSAHAPLHTIHIDGAADHVVVPLRMILREALAHDCHAMLIHHSHLSGDPSPSASDIATTRILCRILRPLEIRLCDHLISAGDQLFSFRAHGLL